MFAARPPLPSAYRVVLVPGVDVHDVSAHLLRTVRELTRGMDEAELHLARVHGDLARAGRDRVR
jgi:hypothetical protein